MVRNIERNDVDVSQLYKWKKDFLVEDPATAESVRLYMRIVGDADMGKARTHGYRRSGEMRRLLREEGSDNRVGMMNELIEFRDKETLATAIVLLKLSGYRDDAIKEVNVAVPKEPKTDSHQMAYEKYQEAVDNYSKLYSEAVEKYMRDRSAKDTEEYMQQDEDILYRTYENLIIDRLCLEELTNSFYNMVVYLSCYTDEKYSRKAFKTFDEFENASSQLKSRLLREYRELELGMDFLNKLREATDSQPLGQTAK